MKLSFNALRDAIMAKLSEAYPEHNIYGESINQNFKRPAFLVQSINPSGGMAGRMHRSRTVMVVVSFYPKGFTDRELLDAVDELDDLLGAPIVTQGRAVTAENVTSETVDNVLHLRMFFSWGEGAPGITVTTDNGDRTEVLPDPEQGYVDGEVETMQELEVKEELG